MKRIQIANYLLAGFAVLLLTAGNAVGQNDTAASAKAKADASARVNANAAGKANVDANARAKADAEAKAKTDAAAKAAADAKAKADAAQAKAEASARAKAEAAAKAKEEARAKAEAEASAKANARVNMEGASLSTVKARLFGTPDNGLLDGKSSFNLHAENMTMTSAESNAFFTSASSQENFAAMIRSAEALHGAIWLEGKIDGQPFEMKLAGRELKVDGLTLTASQRDSLVAELRTIEGLKEMKIGAKVEGRETVTKVSGGQQKLELLGSARSDRDREARGKSGDSARVETSTKVDARERIDGPVRVDGAQRIEGAGRVEVPARLGVDRLTPGLVR